MRSMLVVLLSLSCAAGFRATSRHALSLGRSLNTVQSSRPLRVLRAVESDKAVADNLEEIEGLDGWLIKMGLKVDERVCIFSLHLSWLIVKHGRLLICSHTSHVPDS